MKKILPVLLTLTAFAVLGRAETHYVCLGRIDLAGMVPDTLPATGTYLTFQSVDLALQTPETRSVGYVPGRFREAFQAMENRGLQIEFQVVHVYTRPLPGKYLNVEVWVLTNDLKLISPLIYTVPVYDAQEIASVTEE